MRSWTSSTSLLALTLALLGCDGIAARNPGQPPPDGGDQSDGGEPDDGGDPGDGGDCRTDWSSWTNCTAECGGGTQERFRKIAVTTTEGEVACLDQREDRACNEQPCPVDCEVSDWAWGRCSVKCGGGWQTATREVLVEPAHGGAGCGDLETRRQCNTQSCLNCASQAHQVYCQQLGPGLTCHEGVCACRSNDCPCEIDDDCGEGLSCGAEPPSRCEPRVCDEAVCQSLGLICLGTWECVPGCGSDDDCPENHFCRTDGHCQWAGCRHDYDCVGSKVCNEARECVDPEPVTPRIRVVLTTTETGGRVNLHYVGPGGKFTYETADPAEKHGDAHRLNASPDWGFDGTVEPDFVKENNPIVGYRVWDPNSGWVTTRDFVEHSRPFNGEFALIMNHNCQPFLPPQPFGYVVPAMDATVKVYVDGVEVYTATRALPRSSDNPNLLNNVWEVGTITVDAQGVTVTPSSRAPYTLDAAKSYNCTQQSGLGG